jgi:hypothetical protein
MQALVPTLSVRYGAVPRGSFDSLADGLTPVLGTDIDRRFGSGARPLLASRSLSVGGALGQCADQAQQLSMFWVSRSSIEERANVNLGRLTTR